MEGGGENYNDDDDNWDDNEYQGDEGEEEEETGVDKEETLRSGGTNGTGTSCSSLKLHVPSATHEGGGYTMYVCSLIFLFSFATVLPLTASSHELFIIKLFYCSHRKLLKLLYAW